MLTHSYHPAPPPSETSHDVHQWYAVTTMPRHEKSALAGLVHHGIDAFLPTYESMRAWRNRQKVAIVAPLFPTYLFVRIAHRDRIRVLRTPGVRQLVGNSKGPAAIPSYEVESLRKAVLERRVQPFNGLVEGQKVRVRSGPLHGIEGYLVRWNKDWRVVVKVQLINQHAVLEVDASNLEALDVVEDTPRLRAS